LKEMRCYGVLLEVRSPRTPFLDGNGMVRHFYLVSILRTRGLRRRGNMEVHTIGMELGKPAFHLVGAHVRQG